MPALSGAATTIVVGESERPRPWSPWRHLRTHHPDVKVFEAELPDDMLAWVDFDRRMIFLDCRLSKAEQRSSLAHEIGHLERGSLCDPSREAQEEKAVEEWAARRLIDAAALARAFAWSCRLDEVAEELWVDVPMVRARLRSLTDAEQDALFTALDHARVA